MNERYGRSGWTAGYQLNHAIGQGELLVTPLQLARFFGALGTGRLVQPRLLARSIDAAGLSVDGPAPVSAEVPLPAGVLDPIRAGILAVVEPGSGGTGGRARVPGVRVAGKTGTAENPHGDEHAWFAAYAPAGEPEIVVAVLLERAGHGGAVAAPLAGRILNRYFGRRAGV